MTKTIIVGTNALLSIGRNMFDRGEISIEQYCVMLRRSKTIPTNHKKSIVVSHSSSKQTTKNTPNRNLNGYLNSSAPTTIPPKGNNSNFGRFLLFDYLGVDVV